MHFTVDNVIGQRDPSRDGVRSATVELERGDTAENPASTHRVIYGPAVVTYTQYRDGAIDASVVQASAPNQTFGVEAI